MSGGRLWLYAERASQLLNKATDYNHVELAKRAVGDADRRLLSARNEFRDAKKVFSQVTGTRIKHQQEINALLHRKPNWTTTELGEFTRLCQVEHGVEQAEQTARKTLEACEEAVNVSQSSYLNALREHYHQEQLWSEKGRRISTYGTLSLILFNSVLFLASMLLIEPRKREAIATRVAQDNRMFTKTELNAIATRLDQRLNHLENQLVAEQRMVEQKTTDQQAPCTKNEMLGLEKKDWITVATFGTVLAIGLLK
mmetsp:Transcript_20543/g.33467  ORF Transcript_20543/g.33467 Transcript_20543/m.33467 type:complete len:255 (-) Transcript_20543:419-1183(-)